MRAAALIAALALSALLSAEASAAPPPFGGLTAVGCFQHAAPGPCATTTPTLDGATGVTVSPDGKTVYVASVNSSTVSIFNRSATGALTPAGCVAPVGSHLCGDANVAYGVSGASDVAVTEDGQSLYVAASGFDAVAGFKRAADGSLTHSNCVSDSGSKCANSAGLLGASAVAASPDGKVVYVTANTSDTVSVLTRAADSSLTPAGCIQLTGGSDCVGRGGNADALDGPTDVAVSPLGDNVYVAAHDSSAIAVFNRTPSGGLTPASCVDNVSGGACGGSAYVGMDEATGVAVSPDGANVYVATQDDDAIVTFNRAANGALTPASCIGGSLCPAHGGSAPGLDGATSVVVSPDGKNVYVGSVNGGGGAIATFSRAADGALTAQGCIQQSPGGPCPANAPGVGNADGLAVSPGGNSLYVGSTEGSSLSTFARELGPTCTSAAPTAANPGTTAVALPCPDPNGDPLARTVLTGPTHGTLAAIDQAAATVAYTPNPGFSGTDSFTYAASDGTIQSPPATITITVPPDVTKPALLKLKVSPSKWAVDTKGVAEIAVAKKKKAAKKGTTFSYTLSEPARVVFTIERVLSGRKAGGKCVAQTKSNAKNKRCTRLVRAGRFAAQGKAGKNTKKFSGRIAKKKLAAGSYRATLVATDPSKNASKPARASFTVVSH
jgi:DNA-binding beta-propeller fold protein YncE